MRSKSTVGINVTKSFIYQMYIDDKGNKHLEKYFEKYLLFGLMLGSNSNYNNYNQDNNLQVAWALNCTIITTE